MNLFYTQNIDAQHAHLGEEEARHCVQVLRKKVGDQITIIDGNGGWYQGIIVETGKKMCVASIQSSTLAYKKRPFQLRMAIAPTKNIARMEWFLEKATEIGIDEVIPILCKHSERKRIRVDRLEKIILTAAKQSLKAYVPKLHELTTFNDFIKKEAESNTLSYIAHCDYDNNSHLKDQYSVGKDVTILIGPEGDFSKEEVLLAKEKGFQGIGLGKERLRTETAGIVACHIVNLINT